MESSISLFFQIYLICVSISVLVQIIVFRFKLPKSIFMQLIGLPILSVLASSILCYLYLSKKFSNIDYYYLANLGAGLSAVFSMGLYTFVGPITADRSTAAQLLVLLYGTTEGMTTGELLNKFEARNLLDKRYDEMGHADLILKSKDKIVLTPKGRWIARLYILMINCMDLTKQSTYRDYFSPCRSPEK